MKLQTPAILAASLLLIVRQPDRVQQRNVAELAQRAAEPSAERNAVYPVFAYGTVWGVADDLYGGPEGKEGEPTATGKLLGKLGIPIPTTETVLQPPKAQDAYYRSHYGPVQVMGKGSNQFRELKNPQPVIRERFRSFPLRIEVTTTTGSFITAITRVFVEMDDGCSEPYGIVLYAFSAPRDATEPVFAIPVASDAKASSKIMGKAPAIAVKQGSPHVYAIDLSGSRREVVLEERQTAGGRQQVRLLAKDARSQVVFEREFAHPNDYGSEMYLSPPIMAHGETLPFFAVYSLGKRHSDATGSSWGDWGYERVVFRLLPSGRLEEICSFYIGIGGAQCD